jgi:hypothetical protein
MSLCSPAGIRGELLSSHHTWYESKHPTVEAIPVLSNWGGKNLVQPEGRKSWRRLDSAEG